MYAFSLKVSSFCSFHQNLTGSDGSAAAVPAPPEVSDDAKQLISKLLAMKPTERFTAEQETGEVMVIGRWSRASWDFGRQWRSRKETAGRVVLEAWGGSQPCELSQALNHIWIKEKAPHSRKEPLNTTSVHAQERELEALVQQ